MQLRETVERMERTNSLWSIRWLWSGNTPHVERPLRDNDRTILVRSPWRAGTNLRVDTHTPISGLLFGVRLPSTEICTCTLIWQHIFVRTTATGPLAPSTKVSFPWTVSLPFRYRGRSLRLLLRVKIYQRIFDLFLIKNSFRSINTIIHVHGNPGRRLRIPYTIFHEHGSHLFKNTIRCVYRSNPPYRVNNIVLGQEHTHRRYIRC